MPTSRRARLRISSESKSAPGDHVHHCRRDEVLESPHAFWGNIGLRLEAGIAISARRAAVDAEARIPSELPIRIIRCSVNEVLASLDAEFAAMYFGDRSPLDCSRELLTSDAPDREGQYLATTPGTSLRIASARVNSSHSQPQISVCGQQFGCWRDRFR